MRKRYWWMSAPILALMIVTDVSAQVEARQDDGWLAWYGCWRPDGDTSETRLCIVPAAQGVRIITLNGAKVESESRLIADGQLHNVDQEGCKGTERATWSADRQRVFLRSDLTCGSTIPRKVTGIFALTSPKSWISVQGVTSGGTTGTRMVRYVESQPAILPDDVAETMGGNRLARETARAAGASLLDLNDVREALANADARVVEDWLTAVGQPFNLDGRTLIQLADAGVPGSTIDVLVAVSHPEHFAVADEPVDDYGRIRDPRRVRGASCWDAAWSGSWYDPFSYRYGGYGYGCYPPGGYYSPWAFGGYYGGWNYGPVIVVDRGKQERGGKATRGGYSSGRSEGSSARGRRDDSPSSTPSTQRTNSGTSAGSAGTGSASSGSSSGEKAKKRD